MNHLETKIIVYDKVIHLEKIYIKLWNKNASYLGILLIFKIMKIIVITGNAAPMFTNW